MVKRYTADLNLATMELHNKFFEGLLPFIFLDFINNSLEAFFSYDLICPVLNLFFDFMLGFPECFTNFPKLFTIMFDMHLFGLIR